MIYTLVPLGNPGNKYANTRHNAARVLLRDIYPDVLALPHVEVFVPETFMNESGKAVDDYLRYHEGRELIVMYDDKDLAYGTFRISYDRGDGGHNGLKSIIESLGKKDFIRFRIGIAPSDVDGKEVLAPHGDAVQGYVMGNITTHEEESLRKVAPQVLGALKMLSEHGYTKVMEVYNRT
jgi:PTH1 family peptidyl-tRNA hydrolase